MNEFTRRGIMKLIGMTPAAIPLASAMVPQLLAQAVPLMATAGAASKLMDAALPSGGPGSRSESILGKFLLQQLHDARKMMMDEEEAAYGMRIDGIDVDLVSLKSVSPLYRATMQRQRVVESRAMRQKIDALIWQ